MDRKGKFKKPKGDPFERKRKVLEQIERTDPKRRNWKDYLDEDEETGEEGERDDEEEEEEEEEEEDRD